MTNIHRNVSLNDKRKSLQNIKLLRPIPEIKVENKLDAIISIQSYFKMKKQRMKFLKIRDAAMKIQRYIKGRKIRKIFLLITDAIVFIQSVYRGYRVRKLLKHNLKLQRSKMNKKFSLC